jgi:hypothetical protein
MPAHVSLRTRPPWRTPGAVRGSGTGHEGPEAVPPVPRTAALPVQDRGRRAQAADLASRGKYSAGHHPNRIMLTNAFSRETSRLKACPMIIPLPPADPGKAGLPGPRAAEAAQAGPVPGRRGRRGRDGATRADDPDSRRIPGETDHRRLPPGTGRRIQPREMGIRQPLIKTDHPAVTRWKRINGQRRIPPSARTFARRPGPDGGTRAADAGRPRRRGCVVPRPRAEGRGMRGAAPRPFTGACAPPPACVSASLPRLTGHRVAGSIMRKAVRHEP